MPTRSARDPRSLLFLVAACLIAAGPAWAGLIAHYDFEDYATPGTALDAAGGHTGTLNGSAAFSFDSRVGRAAMGLNGGGDISIPYSSAFDINTFSVSAWVKIPAEQGDGGILGTRFGGDTTFDLKVRASDIHGDVGSGGGWINTGVDIRSTDTGSNGQGGDLAHNAWYLVTYVIDDSAKQFRLYLDGDLKRTIGYSGTPRLMKPGQEMRLGNASGGERLNGLLDDVRIYDHALSDPEIAGLAQPESLREPIGDLFNTGVDGDGVVLSGGSPAAPVNDPHYDITEFAGSPVTPYDAFVAEADGFPIPPWLANDALSRWIDPTGGEDSNAPEGPYTYRATFTLPRHTVLDSVIITGRWATDNLGTDILINGTSTGQTNTAQFGSLTSFLIDGGFVEGINTIDFMVDNSPSGANPTALRVQYDIARYDRLIPEPSSLALLGIGLLAARARRRRASRSA